MSYKMSWTRLIAYSLFIALLGCLSAAAFAHHPTGGSLPETVGHGFLSGLGHPLLGLEHLFFLMGLAGVASMISVRHTASAAIFVATSVVGSLIHVSGISLAFPHLMVSASILGAGALLAAQWQPPRMMLVTLGAVAGLWHGFAYGEAVSGAAPAVIGAYVVGLVCVQATLLAVAAVLMHRLRARWPYNNLLIFRVAGSAVCLFGAGFAVFG